MLKLDFYTEEGGKMRHFVVFLQPKLSSSWGAWCGSERPDSAFRKGWAAPEGTALSHQPFLSFLLEAFLTQLSTWQLLRLLGNWPCWKTRPGSFFLPQDQKALNCEDKVCPGLFRGCSLQCLRSRWCTC